jgi:chromosome segregation ATPase
MQGQRKWKGKVIGPIGAYMKIAPGKERYAKLAELALGGGLDRFIVTNADDKATFMRLRNEIGCRRECNIYSVTPAPRYQIPLSPVEGIVTVASCFTIEDDLVFNTLADQCKFDTKAIGDSKEDTEQLLLQTDNRGNESIRGGKIAEVSFFPKGDVWTINKQGSRNMRSNERQLKQTIGADNQSAIAQANEEIQQLKHELHEHQKQHEAHKMQILKAKKAWNEVKKAQRNAKQAIEELENNISHLQTEVDASTSLEETDTTELEEDVTNIEEDLTVLNEKLEANDREKEEFEPEIDRLEQKVEEVEARNERILADMEIAEKDLTVFISKSSEREEAKEKADKKLEKIQATLVEMTSALAEKRGDFDAALRTARLLQYRHEYAVQMKAQAGEREEGAPSTPDLTPEDPEDEELEAVEIEEPPKEANYYEAKIARLRLRIQEEREKRSISNVSFEESYERYQRAKNLLESKNKQLEQIAENVEKLAKDLASRKKRWKTFRKHLVTMSQSTFDEILQLKGSAGDLDFNHDDKTLNLVVQKDNTDASSQTKDVKALSGGERSFVTLSLLLAIGERLETPFRVMDEFDVFLDPVSRKIAMDTLVEIAKKMDHRQFILITPQDLSNITPDDKVKIFKLLPPARSNAVTGLTQQTLD